MKFKKVNGLYRKSQLKAVSRVPLLIWLPILLISASIIIILSLRIWIENSAAVPDQPIVRKASWKIAAVGDIACSPDNPNYNNGLGLINSCQMKAVGEAIEKENIDALLLLGDIQYDKGIFEDFEKSFVPYFRDITVPIYSVPGNHDYANPVASVDGYKKAFEQYMSNVTYAKEGNTYYDFNLGPWKFYALDSNCNFVGGCTLGSEQYSWLTSKVMVDESICSIAFWHHPLFTSGLHKDDVDILDRQDFWSVLDSYGADIVLNGHDHNYERFEKMNSKGESTPDGMREFVSGAGGYDLRPIDAQRLGSEKIIDDNFGYLYLELYPGRYEWSFKNVLGEVLDKGSDSCN